MCHVGRHGLSERLTFQGGDFFRDALSQADVLVMGHILHDWNLDEKKQLVARTYEALPAGAPCSCTNRSLMTSAAAMNSAC